MSKRQNRRSLTLTVRDGFAYIAIWQSTGFVILILLVWVNEVLDLAHLLFGVAPSPLDVARGCMATAGILTGLVISIGITYIQQQRIVGGLLAICSYCKKIRINQDAWKHIEDHLSSHSRLNMTHGVCPDCFDRVSGDFARERQRGARQTNGGQDS